MKFPRSLDFNLLLIIPFFIFLLGIKRLIIDLYANSTPYWDQWDAEAANLYLPLINGRLNFFDLFAAHNEHRIFTTRLLGLFLFEANGRVWNPILQMVVNAFIHILSLCMLLFLLGKSLPKRSLIPLLIFSFLILCIPLGWENTLSGFQAQFYLLLLFTFIFLRGMSKFSFGSFEWWWAFFAGLLCPLTLASGSISLIAGATILLIRRLSFNENKKVPMWTIALLILVSIVAIYYTPIIPTHSSLKAQSFSDFFASLATALSWPSNIKYVGFILVQAPLIFFGYFFYRYSSFRTNENLFICAIALWFFGQAMSISYGRFSAPTTSRYLDIYVVGIILNATVILSCFENKNFRKKIIYPILLWLIVVLFGIYSDIGRLNAELKQKAINSLEQEKNVRAYLCTSDYGYLQNKKLLELPYPSPDRLKMLLDDSAIRSFLPSNLAVDKNIPSSFCLKTPPLLISLGKWDGSHSFMELVTIQALLRDGVSGRDYFNQGLLGFRVIGTYKTSDQDVGLISIQVKKNQKILYRSGPVNQNQFLLYSFNRSSSRNFIRALPVAYDWSILEFNDPNLPDVFEITVMDLGSNWGEWSAVALKEK